MTGSGSGILLMNLIPHIKFVFFKLKMGPITTDANGGSNSKLEKHLAVITVCHCGIFLLYRGHHATLKKIVKLFFEFDFELKT